MKHLFLLLLCVIAMFNSQAQTVFFSEIHYDNISTDTLEGFEIAGPAGTNLSCYMVYFYNGNLGTVYDSLALTGTIDNEGGSGYGAVWFAFAGLQNGATSGAPAGDGMALVSIGGAGCPAAGVISFIGYDGTFTATNGPANGMTPINIGVLEDGTAANPIGNSLALNGTGTTYPDFFWAGSAPSSYGSINPGMTFGTASADGVVNGIIYDDTNTNCIQDGAEMGIAGLTVTLTGAGADNTLGTADDIIITQTTSATGAYSFSSLVYGNYSISITPPTSYTSGVALPILVSVISSSAITENICLQFVSIPTVTITPATLSVAESGASVSFTINLSAAGATALNVDLSYTGTATSATDYVPTVTPVSIPAGTTTMTFNITINDDGVSEATETIIVTLLSGAGYTLGGSTTSTISITDNDISLSPISTYTGEDATGAATSLGVNAGVEGVVHGINYRASATGTSFTIIDATGGINVYNGSSTLGYTVTEGDRVRVYGTITQFNGLTQIDADSILLQTSGNPLSTPTSVTSLTETNESQMVTLSGSCWNLVTPSDWNNTGVSGFTIQLSNGAQTVAVRIDNDVDFYSTYATAPGTALNFTGIGSQFDSATPFDSGYQLTPRGTVDLFVCTDIEENISNPKVVINNNVLTINSQYILKQVSLLDANGKLVENILLSSNTKNIDLSNYNAGLYVAVIQTELGLTYQKIMIK